MVESALERSERRSLLASENGGALIIALLAVVMLMLMGLTLLQVLRSGLIQSSSSEASVQAEILAQNGLDEALVYIQSVVDNANKIPTLSYRDRAKLVKDGLRFEGKSSSLKGMNNQFVDTAKGSYKFAIDTENGSDLELEKSKLISNPNKSVITPFPDLPYVHRVVVRAKGISKVKTARTVVKQMIVYVSSINPVFRYPVSSEANLSLNGAPYILGDVLVRGGLTTSETANFKISSDSKYTNKFGSACDKRVCSHLSSSNGSPYLFKKAAPYEDNGLTLDQDIIVGNIDCGSNVNSVACKSAYVNKRIQEGALLPKNNHQDPSLGESLLGDGQQSAAPSTGIPASDYNHSVNVKGKLQMLGNLIIDGGLLSMEPTKDVGSNPILPKITLKNEGNIFIRNTALPNHELIVADLTGTIEWDHSTEADTYLAVVGDVNLDNFQLKGGNMFVSGNVTVRGDLRMNGTLFVDGDVDFKEISSINPDESDSPLIIIASGKITLADHRKLATQNPGCNNDTTKNENCLRAFLYSKDDMNLYGVLSDQVIKGGVHGKNVELNAVRGNVVNAAIANSDASYSDQMVLGKDGLRALTGQYYFKTAQNAGQLQDSRLQLLYDNKLYTNPPRGIPIIEGVMDVFVKEISTLPAGSF